MRALVSTATTGSGIGEARRGAPRRGVGRVVVTRAPIPALRPFVKLLWASDEDPTRLLKGPARELVLPTGAMHLVVRLSDHPLRLYEHLDDQVGHIVGHAVVGGARAGAYLRDVSGPARSVGAQLLPGAAFVLFGARADELAGRHTPLEDLWGRSADEARERLIAAGPAGRQLDVFESLLAARMPRVHGLHPAVAHALERFSTTHEVRRVVNESGYSHRRFIEVFRAAVGLGPKLYCRVLRFQGALDLVAARPEAALVDVALEAGYSDQPHFQREFRELAGVSPTRYRDLSPAFAHHVPLR
jgi:AraC-like DNA-binding protein